MTKFSLHTLILGLLIGGSCQTLASGRTVGNGGNIVSCLKAQGPAQHEVLDYYEARVLRETIPDFYATGNTLDDKVYFILERLRRLSPDRAALYQKYYSVFFNETQWLLEGGLNTIPDSDHIISPPPGCIIQQTINQSTPLLPTDKRYFIDKKIWDQLDLNQKAGLVLHEIIYREALSIGHTNSVSSRYLNGVISSEQINFLSVVEFTQLLRDLGFTTNTIQGVTVDLTHPFEFFENGQLQQATVSPLSPYFLKNQTLLLRDRIRFYQSGQPESFFLAEPTTMKFMGPSMEIAPFEVLLHENGLIKKWTLQAPALYQSPSINIEHRGVVEYFDNGQLAKSIAKGTIQITSAKEAKQIEIQGPLEFFRSGTPKTFILQNPVSWSLFGKALEITGVVELDEKGALTRFALTQEQRFQIQGTSEVFITPFSTVTMDKSRLKSFKVSRTARLLDQFHRAHTYPAGTFIELNNLELVSFPTN